MSGQCHCVNCGTILEYPEALSGSQINCPNCTRSTMLPGRQPSPAKPSLGKRALRFSLITIAIALGIILGISALGFFLIRAGDNGGMAVFVVVGLIVYFAPSIVGYKKRNASAIFALNLLAGWTFIGWIIAAVWASTRDPEHA